MFTSLSHTHTHAPPPHLHTHTHTPLHTYTHHEWSLCLASVYQVVRQREKMFGFLHIPLMHWSTTSLVHSSASLGLSLGVAAFLSQNWSSRAALCPLDRRLLLRWWQFLDAKYFLLAGDLAVGDLFAAGDFLAAGRGLQWLLETYFTACNWDLCC